MSEALPATLDRRENLPGLLARAGQRLLDARNSAEVLEAKKLAELALHYAKVMQAANETHADCLRIIARAEIRMANEADRAQDSGELPQQGQHASHVQGSDMSAVGLDRRRLAEWRDVRDAGEEVVDQTIAKALDEGRAPTKAEIVEAANRIKREKKQKKKQERKAHVATLAAAVKPTAERFQVYNEDCAAALEWTPGTVDFVITDPPYAQEHVSAYRLLGEIAKHVLRPGGSLLCMTGHSFLPEYYATLSVDLTYHWTLAYLLPGGQAVQVFPRKVNTFWKPVLWFTKGEYNGEWIGDVCRSDTNDNDKRFHDWGQSESGFRDLMRRFVSPGDVVLDPFMGAGTTGVIALELGAQFFGFDTDADAYNEALVRMGRADVAA